MFTQIPIPNPCPSSTDTASGGGGGDGGVSACLQSIWIRQVYDPPTRVYWWEYVMRRGGGGQTEVRSVGTPVDPGGTDQRRRGVEPTAAAMAPHRAVVDPESRGRTPGPGLSSDPQHGSTTGKRKQNQRRV